MKKRNRHGDRRKPVTVVAKELFFDDDYILERKKEKIKKMIQTYGHAEDKWSVCIMGRSVGSTNDGIIVLTLQVRVTENDPLGVLKLCGYGSCSIGKIDLLALLGAEIREIDSKECVVIPLEDNPTIEVKAKRNGSLKAQMDILLKDIDGKYGNSHFIKAIVNKLSLEKMSMTYIEARQFTPILGNIKP